MSDGVAITAGVGTVIAADDCGAAGAVQVIKQGFGGDGRLESSLVGVSINCAGAGDNTIVAAVALQSVRLYSFFFSVNGIVNVKWKDGAGTDFHPVIYLLGQGGYWFLPPLGQPWFTTTVGNALILNLSAAVQTSGRAYYAQSA